MIRQRLPLLVAAAAVAAACASLAAPGDTFLTPEAAGPDWQVQGEYVGRAGTVPYGAQVIALGKGAFQAVLLRGGLPGAGWDRSPRIRLAGLRTGDKVRFEPGEGWTLTQSVDTLAGESPDGAVTLRRTVRRSPTEGKQPPRGGAVLFDGTGTAEWSGGRMDGDRLLLAGAQTRRRFRDFALHLEFRTPFKPEARGQSRGNSGLYVNGRYEIQILDSFGLDGRDSECGAIYRQRAPDLNMCFPPLTWQTYDLEFTAPRFGPDGRKVRNATIHLLHNGVVVHNRVDVPLPTGNGQRRGETAEAGPLSIQNHGNPVAFRNVWAEERPG